MSQTTLEPTGASQSPERRPGNRGRARRVLLASIGILATALALIGLFVPLLPTTPLLLLAAACFMRSSDRLYRWLIGNRWFGPVIQSYRAHRAVPRRTKTVALILLWSVIGSSVLLAGSWWVRGLLLVIASLVTVHVARLRSTEDILAARGAVGAPTTDPQAG